MTENPAETIRRAATLMRQLAEAAQQGAWRMHPGHLGGAPTYVLPAGEGTSGAVAECWGDPDNATGAHIASWHPAVALAVADWLSEAADAYERWPDAIPGHSLKVARAYLGEPTP